MLCNNIARSPYLALISDGLSVPFTKPLTTAAVAATIQTCQTIFAVTRKIKTIHIYIERNIINKNAQIRVCVNSMDMASEEREREREALTFRQKKKNNPCGCYPRRISFYLSLRAIACVFL